jgi:Grx4 family monothiol glutaredoxin
MASLAKAPLVHDITDLTQWTTFLTQPANLVVVFFWAEFHPPSKLGGQMDTLYTALATKHSTTTTGGGGSENKDVIKFVKVNVEDVPEVVDMYPVTDVPTFVFLRPGKAVQVLGTMEGANPGQLAQLIVRYQKDAQEVATAEMEQRLQRLTSSAPVMVFMKGIPAEPKCKFSRALVELLKEQNVSYGSFNILEDPAVRAALKNFSGWKTYPQIYQHGKLVGGLDTVKAMKEEAGSLARLVGSGSAVDDAVKKAAAKKKSDEQKKITDDNEETQEELNERISKLITMGQVVLFMKGTPEEPKCGFSRTMVSLLQQETLEFETFDILEDSAVRERLKIVSDWPTYPQLYVNGELQGGLDVVKEMIEDEGSLKEACGVIPTEDRLKTMIASATVFLFMKGNRDVPRCGFSRTMIGLLNEAKIAYETFDILSDKGIRRGIKTYSDWPTFPQLYVSSELIGGLDIVKEMVEDDGIDGLKESLGL